MEIDRLLVLSTAHPSAESRRFLDAPPSRRVEGWPGLRHDGAGLFEEVTGDPERPWRRWLEGGGDALVAYPTPFGWFCHVHDDGLDDFPADLRRILREAAALGCGWVQLDRDGPELSGLATFDEEGRTAPQPAVPSQAAAVLERALARWGRDADEDRPVRGSDATDWIFGELIPEARKALAPATGGRNGAEEVQ